MTTFPSCHSDWSSNSAVVQSANCLLNYHFGYFPWTDSRSGAFPIGPGKPNKITWIKAIAKRFNSQRLPAKIRSDPKNARGKKVAPSTNLMKRRKQAAPKPATGPTSKAQRQTSQVGHLKSRGCHESGLTSETREFDHRKKPPCFQHGKIGCFSHHTKLWGNSRKHWDK